MGFYNKSYANWQKFYYIDRPEDRLKKNYELLSRTDVDDYLSTAPVPPGGNRYKYPKVHKNLERQYQHSGPLYEYPSETYPYDKQNYRGHVPRNDGSGKHIDVGYKRTVTDRYKDIQGISYHPQSSLSRHRRAAEIYDIPSRSDPHYYSSYQTYPSRRPFDRSAILADINHRPSRNEDYPYSSSFPRNPSPLYPRTRSPPWATHSRSGTPEAFMRYKDLSYDPYSRW